MKFATPVGINELHRSDVNIAKKPYFYNDAGVPKYLSKLPPRVKPLQPAAVDPAIAMGNEYVVADILGVRKNAKFGTETQFGIGAKEVVFEPMWATRDVAAAFGITLIEPGQAIRIESPVPKLQHIDYEYGVFAGHWSPYQKTGDQLLSVVCTDLEHHDFPHVFASIDPWQPLVTSVGRYWPKLGKIRLADLWVPRGCALYIPPMPSSPDAECIDLHNNRNSARACWGDIRQNSIVTQTLLLDKGGYFYWYWNAIPTVHSRPADVR